MQFTIENNSHRPVVSCRACPLNPPPRRASKPSRNDEKKIASCERSRPKWISESRVNGAGKRKSISASLNASCARASETTHSAITYTASASAASVATSASRSAGSANFGTDPLPTRNIRWNRKKYR